MKDLLTSTLILVVMLAGTSALIGGSLYLPGIDYEFRGMLVLCLLTIPSAVSLGGYFMAASAAR